MEKRAKILIIIAVAGLLLVQIPTVVPLTFNGPKEDGKYIRRVYGEHSVGQLFTLEQPIDAIEIFARSAKPQQSELIVTNEIGERVTEQTIQLTEQDTWQRIELTNRIPSGKHSLVFTSPKITEVEEAILLRFQIESHFYEGGVMIVDGQESYGDLAFRTFTRAPAWKALLLWGQVTDKSIQIGVKYALIGTLLAVVLITTEQYINRAPKKQKKRAIVVMLATIFICAVAIRLPYIIKIQGVFGGDAFNYLSKAIALTKGNDPFAADPRKAPLYSLLILPGLFTDDPLMFSRIIGIIASSVAVICITLIGRALRLPWSIAAGAGILLAVNKDFIWEAPSGLANSLYACLITASTLAFIKASTKKWQWALAVLLGLTFLTRYEGALVAVVYMSALWFRQRLPIKQTAKLAGAALLIMLIPQVSYIWSGVPGIRTVGDIQADGGLSLAGNFQDYIANIDQLRGFAISTWLLPKHDNLIIPALWWGMLAGLVIVLIKRKFPSIALHAMPWSAAIVFVIPFLLFSMKNDQAFGYIAAIPWFLTGVGAVALLIKRDKKFEAIIIAIMVITQIMFITQILPKPRYYLQVIPYFALAIAFGIYTATTWSKSIKARAVSVVCIGLIASYLYVRGGQDLAPTVDQYNFDARRTHIMIQAALAARQAQGVVAFYGQDELQIKTLIPDGRYVFVDPDDNLSLEKEQAFIQNNNVSYLMQRDEEKTWNILSEMPDAVSFWQSFSVSTGETVSIYKIIDN